MPRLPVQKGFTRRIGGFTLVELLIVIALLALLLTAGIFGSRLQLKKSFDAIRKRDLNNLKIAFEHYYSEHECYPPASTLNDCDSAALAPYLDKIPCDPETKNPYTLTLDSASCAQKYYLYTDLSNTKDPQILCNGKYGASSSNVTQAEIDLTCKGQSFCQGGYYACVQGACVLISSVTKPACAPLFCTSNCQSSCSLSGWEVYPQPCYP